MIEEKKPGKAKDYFLKLIKAYPQTDRAILSRYELGLIYMEEENWKLASRNLTIAQKKLDKGLVDLKVRLARAIVYEKTEQLGKALKFLEEAIEIYSQVIVEEVNYSEEERKEIRDMSKEKKSTKGSQKPPQSNQPQETDGKVRLHIPGIPRWIRELKNPSTSYKQRLKEKILNSPKLLGLGNLKRKKQ